MAHQNMTKIFYDPHKNYLAPLLHTQYMVLISLLSISIVISLGYLNINVIRNKFSSISHLTDTNLDIFAITKIKLDSSFPESQFILTGMMKPF